MHDSSLCSVLWRSAVLANAVGLMLTVPAFMYAQESSNPTALSLEELLDTNVYSASKYEQKAAEAPSSIVVINSEQIQKYGYRTLLDVLATLPGFYVQGHGSYRSVGVRGFSPPGESSSRILLLVNGHALNSNIDGSAPLDTTFPIDMDLIDRIEIVRGPSSSLYGAGAFFAVVNVITRTGMNKGVMVSGEGGSFGTYKETASYGLEHNGTQALLAETYNLTNAPGQLDGIEDPIAHSSDRDQGRRLFALVSSHEFTLQAAVSGLQERNPTSTQWCGTCHQTDSQANNFRAYADLQYDHSFGSSVQFTARTYYDSSAYHGHYNDLRGCSTSACHGSVFDHNISHGDWAGAEAKITKRLAAGHRFTVGAEYRDNFRQDQSNWIDGFVDTHGGTPSTSQSFVDYDRTSHLWGIYGEAELRLLSKLILNLGVRNDRYSYVEAKTNPRAALIYSPRQSTTLKFLYGNAFRAPSFSEMYYTEMGSASAPLLRPETIRTQEVVLGQNFGKRTSLEFSGFYNLIGNYIQQQTNVINGQDQLTFINSKASAKGAELELRSKLSSGLQGAMSYTFQDVRDPLNDASLPDSPRSLAKMQVDAPLMHGFLTPGIEAQYQSRCLVSYPVAELQGSNALGYFGPPVLINASVLSRQYWHGFSLSATVYNLVGRSMSDPMAGYFEQDHMVAANSLLPNDRRTFRIKLTWTSAWERADHKVSGAEKSGNDSRDELSMATHSEGTH